MSTVWLQRPLQLAARSPGIHLITEEVLAALPEIKSVSVGILHVFIQHTSASLTINENASPDVTVDLRMALDRLVPEGAHYRHDEEGPDDMPAHVKTALLDTALTIPVGQGRLQLGTWQGFFCASTAAARNRGSCCLRCMASPPANRPQAAHRHRRGDRRQVFLIPRCAEIEPIAQDLDLRLPASQWSAWVHSWRSIE